jgi:hypothetical protein
MRLALLLLVAYGWLFVFSAPVNNPNELVRAQMARAIAFEHTYAIGERRADGDHYVSWGYVNDKALVCAAGAPPRCEGKLYAAKAPGASLLAAPIVLLLGRGASPTLTILVLRWLLCILPSIAFWLWFKRALGDYEIPQSVALAVTLAAALGSLSLTYGQMFAGHQLGLLALGTALLLAFGERQRPALLGFACAAAVCLEYPCAPAAALIALIWLPKNMKGLSPFLAGAALPTLLLLHFHWAAFGAPWATPYSHLENPGFVRDLAPGFMGISIPTFERIYGSLISPYLGLFFWAPWMALLFPALALWRRSPAALACAAVTVYYLVFQVTHALWRSGWVIGPRYITPIVPFAALLIALWLREKPRALTLLCGGAVAAIAATGLASSVCQGFPLEVQNPLREVVWPLLSHGWVQRNPLQLAGVPGLWSALPYLAALAAAIALLIRLAPRPLAAAALAAALIATQWLAPINPEGRGAAGFFQQTWEPSPPPGATRF